MKRRSFLGILFSALGISAVGTTGYPLLRYLAPHSGAEKTNKHTFNKSDIGDVKEILFRQTPSIIINRPGKGYIALSRVCTHLGCLLEYDSATKTLVCPCHAGSFDLEGRVIAGPPPKQLIKFPLDIQGDNITIG